MMRRDELTEMQNRYEALRMAAQAGKSLDGRYTENGFAALVQAAEIQLKMADALPKGKEADHHRKKAIELCDEAQAAEKIRTALDTELSESANSAPPDVQRKSEGQSVEAKGGKKDGPIDMSAWVVKQAPNVSFDDIIGLEDVKEKLYALLDQSEERKEVNEKYDIIPPRMFLLYGPPGTGKTMIAKAIATKLVADGCPMYTATCSTLLNKYVGETAKHIRALFDEVTKHESACLFLDEFDAICPIRGSGEGERHDNQMTTELLTCVDGFSSKTGGMILICATNNPSLVDPAMLSRFKGQHIYGPLPGKEERKDKIRKTLEKMKIDKKLQDITYDELADLTEGFNYRDLEGYLTSIKTTLGDRDRQTGTTQSVTRDIAQKKRDAMRPSVTPEMLARYSRFENK